VVRYEHPAPGDLLHLDIKAMTRFSDVTLRGDGRLRGRRMHRGFLALHVAVDDHSRMAFTQLLPDRKAEATIAFLRSVVEFFARHGIGVRALLTDNGSSYRSHHFRHACQQMQLKHSRTRPYYPENQWQGGTLYPDRPARVGLRKILGRLRRKRRTPQAMERLLQPPTTSS
jgi:transposase InsO family protein